MLVVERFRIHRSGTGLFDLRELSPLCGFGEIAEFQLAHGRWIDDSLTRVRMVREGRWSEAIAIGKLNFVTKMKSELGLKGSRREVIDEGGTYAIREQSEAYGPILAVKTTRC